MTFHEMLRKSIVLKNYFNDYSKHLGSVNAAIAAAAAHIGCCWALRLKGEETLEIAENGAVRGELLRDHADRGDHANPPERELRVLVLL